MNNNSKKGDNRPASLKITLDIDKHTFQNRIENNRWKRLKSKVDHFIFIYIKNSFQKGKEEGR